VWEYIDSSLSEKCRVTAQEMVEIVRQMMDGMTFLHEHGLVHGGIHEKNIWVMPEGPLHIKLGWYKDLVEADLKLCQASDIQEAGKLLLNRALSSRCVWEKNNRNGRMTNLGKAPIYRPGPMWSDLGGIAIEMMEADWESTAKYFQSKLCLPGPTLSFEEQQDLNISFLKEHGGSCRGFLEILTSQTPPAVDRKKANSMVFDMEDCTVPALQEPKGSDVSDISLQDLSGVLGKASRSTLWTLGVGLQNLQKRVEDEHLADYSVLRVLVRNALHGTKT